MQITNKYVDLPSPCVFRTVQHGDKVYISVKNQVTQPLEHEDQYKCLTISISNDKSGKIQINSIKKAYIFAVTPHVSDRWVLHERQHRKWVDSPQVENGSSSLSSLLFTNNQSAFHEMLGNDSIKYRNVSLKMKEIDQVAPIQHSTYATCKYNTQNFSIHRDTQNQYEPRLRHISLPQKYLQCMRRMNHHQIAAVYSRFEYEADVDPYGIGLFNFDIQAQQVSWSYLASGNRHVFNSFNNVDDNCLLVGLIQNYCNPFLCILDTRVAGIVSKLDINEPTENYVLQLSSICKINNQEYAAVSGPYGLRRGNLLKIDIRFPQSSIILKQSIQHFRHFFTRQHGQNLQFWCICHTFKSFQYQRSIVYKLD